MNEFFAKRGKLFPIEFISELNPNDEESMIQDYIEMINNNFCEEIKNKTIIIAFCIINNFSPDMLDTSVEGLAKLGSTNDIPTSGDRLYLEEGTFKWLLSEMKDIDDLRATHSVDLNLDEILEKTFLTTGDAEKFLNLTEMRFDKAYYNLLVENHIYNADRYKTFFY